MDTIVTKKCGKCGEYKLKCFFGKDARAKDGLQYCCRDCDNLRCATYRTKYKDVRTKRRRDIRKDVINHYGGACACCGEKQIQFLSIDHINGGGNKHKKSLGKGVKTIFRWLQKNNYPVGFQILCFNCNLAKGFYGKCPHER